MAFDDGRSDRPRQRQRNRLLNAESVESYERGGFHPVELGDRFQAERYEIVRKLGHGSSSTVWLAKDLAKDSRYHYSMA